MTTRRSFFKSLTGAVVAAAMTTLGWRMEKAKWRVTFAAAYEPVKFDAAAWNGAMKWVGMPRYDYIDGKWVVCRWTDDKSLS